MALWAGTPHHLSLQRALGCSIRIFVLPSPCKAFCATRCWFKGADTTSLCVYLEDKLREVLPTISPENKPYFETMLRMLGNCNLFMRTLYHADLWLMDNERSVAISSGMLVIKDFKRCALHAFKEQKTRWKLQPKMHFIGEILFRLELHRRLKTPSLNPLATGTQIDEDFVGAVCSMSRTVSGRKIHTRTLRKYALALASLW